MLETVFLVVSGVAFLVALYAFVVAGESPPEFPDCERSECDREARYLVLPSKRPVCAFHSHSPDLNGGLVVRIEEFEKFRQSYDEGA